MKKPLVSVVVPIFNAERYLSKCIESILVQTYKNLELILINDGSTDSSLITCKKYEDSRVRIINQKNQGVSHTRNCGIQNANGDLIVFVDADDTLPIDSLELRVQELCDADMLISRYINIDENGCTLDKMPKCSKEYWKKNEALVKLFDGSEIGYQGYIWNKVFRTEIIRKHDILFDENLYYNEDRLFVLKYILHCEHIKISDSVVYYYRRNPSSAMGIIQNNIIDSAYERILTEFTAYDIMKGYLKRAHIEAYYTCIYDELCRANFIAFGIKKSKFKQTLREIKKNNKNIILYSNELSIIRKEKYMLKYFKMYLALCKSSILKRNSL